MKNNKRAKENSEQVSLVPVEEGHHDHGVRHAAAHPVRYQSEWIILSFIGRILVNYSPNNSQL